MQTSPSPGFFPKRSRSSRILQQRHGLSNTRVVHATDVKTRQTPSFIKKQQKVQSLVFTLQTKLGNGKSILKNLTRWTKTCVQGCVSNVARQGASGQNTFAQLWGLKRNVFSIRSGVQLHSVEKTIPSTSQPLSLTLWRARTCQAR